MTRLPTPQERTDGYADATLDLDTLKVTQPTQDYLVKIGQHVLRSLTEVALDTNQTWPAVMLLRVTAK